MAKKKQEDPPKGSPAWMSTFSDLMNLLLCFFVLLFSMSNIDAQKFQEIAASLASSFSILSDGATSLGEGILISSGVSQLNELSDYYNSMGLNTDGENDEFNDAYQEMQKGMINESEKMAENLAKDITDKNMADQIEVIVSSHYVALNMRSGILFDSGSADLRDDAKKVLDSVGDILREYNGYTIEIIGHTDNLPTDTRFFADNLDLSFYRAKSVYTYLIDKFNLDKKGYKPLGMGEKAPIAGNDTAEGRAKNRRVEIRIYNKLSGV